MQALAAQPSLNQLNGFITKVRSYPVSAKQLIQLGQKVGAPKAVIDFYQSFDPQRQFNNHDDLATSSEQVDILRKEQSEMPREEERSPEDY